jgi:hypothetical protein
VRPGLVLIGRGWGKSVKGAALVSAAGLGERDSGLWSQAMAKVQAISRVRQLRIVNSIKQSQSGLAHEACHDNRCREWEAGP